MVLLVLIGILVLGVLRVLAKNLTISILVLVLRVIPPSNLTGVRPVKKPNFHRD